MNYDSSHKILLGLFFVIFIYHLKKAKDKRLLSEFKKIIDLEYFYILEEDHKKDHEKRKDSLGLIVGLFLSVFFFIITLIHPYVKSGNFLESKDNVYLLCFLVITFIVYILLMRYNYVIVTSLLLIMLCLLVFIASNKEVTNCERILVFLVIILFALSYPAPYLRKVSSFIDTCKDILIIVLLGGAVGGHGAEYSIIIPLMIAILTVVIKIRLKQVKKKAEKIYNQLKKGLVSEDKIYTECKKCVYYGGESFKERIIDNDKWYKIIDKFETESERED